MQGIEILRPLDRPRGVSMEMDRKDCGGLPWNQNILRLWCHLIARKIPRHLRPACWMRKSQTTREWKRLRTALWRQPGWRILSGSRKPLPVPSTHGNWPKEEASVETLVATSLSPKRSCRGSALLPTKLIGSKPLWPPVEVARET